MKKRVHRVFVPLVTDFAEHFRGKVEDWRLAELAELYQDAEGRLLALDTARERRLAEPLELEDVLSPERAERSAAEYAATPEHAALVAEAVRVARTTSQFEVASPGSVSPALLRSMLDAPEAWPKSALYAVLALTAVIMAAEWPERADRYLGAAREAVALADAADLQDKADAAANAKKAARRARLVEFAELYRAHRAEYRGEKEALRSIGERMNPPAKFSTVETYKRDALADGLL